MVHSTAQQRKRDLLLPFGKRGTVTQTVIVRKMTREHYLKRYAKDAEGNYVGTENPAADAGLVFVPGKSTSEELLEQVRKVAFGTEHSNKYFMSKWSCTDSTRCTLVLTPARWLGSDTGWWGSVLGRRI